MFEKAELSNTDKVVLIVAGGLASIPLANGFVWLVDTKNRRIKKKRDRRQTELNNHYYAIVAWIANEGLSMEPVSFMQELHERLYVLLAELSEPKPKGQ